MTNHQQARNAAANLAYPDKQWSNHWTKWGSRIQAERLTQHLQPSGQRYAPWRKWTLTDSQQAIAESDRRRQAWKTGTSGPTIPFQCENCATTFQVLARTARRKPPRYCGRICYAEARRKECQ